MLAREMRVTAVTLWSSRPGQWMRHATHISSRVTFALRQNLTAASATNTNTGLVRLHTEALLLARVMIMRLDPQIWLPLLPACLAAIISHTRTAGPHTLERAVATIHGTSTGGGGAVSTVQTLSPCFRFLLLSGLKFLELCAARAPDVFLPYRELFAPDVPPTHGHPAVMGKPTDFAKTMVNASVHASDNSPDLSAATTALLGVYHALYACRCPRCHHTPSASSAVANKSKGSAHLAPALLPLLEHQGSSGEAVKRLALPQSILSEPCPDCNVVNTTVALCSYAPYEWRNALSVRWGSLRATMSRIANFSELDFVIRASANRDAPMTAQEVLDRGESLLVQDLCSQ